MAKQFQLNIPEPCQESWDRMKPTGCGRFCDSCQKTVVDFTTMNDQQLALFFKKNTASVCGRVRKDQLSKDFSIPPKPIPWLRHLLKVVIPALLFSNKGYTQGAIRKVVPATSQSPVKVQNDEVIIGDSIRTRFITGDVRDQNGNGLAGASVIIHGTPIGAVADEHGFFRLKLPDSKKKVYLYISYVGFNAKQVSCELNDADTETYITLDPMEESVMGDIMMVPVRKKIRVRPPKNVDTDTTMFKVFPNPVPSGASLNIEITGPLKDDYYQFRLISLNGKNIFENKVWIDKGARVMNISIPPIVAGNYIVVLGNTQSKKQFTRQIIITK